MTDLLRSVSSEVKRGRFATLLSRLNSIQTKFLVVLVPPIVIATILVMMIAVWRSYSNLEQELLAKQSRILDANAEALSSPLWNLNTENVESILTAMTVDPDVSIAAILDEHDVEIARVQTPGPLADELITQAKPIQFDTGSETGGIYPLGVLQVDFNRLQLEAEIVQMLIDEAVLLTLLLAVILITSNWAGQTLVASPLQRFLDAIRSAERHHSREPIPLRDRDEISRVMAAYNDLLVRLGEEEAEVARQHQELVDANAELSELSALKNKFVGMAAHDMRNPLIAIRNMSEMILDMDLNEATRQKFLKTVKSTSNQMLDLLTDLLDVSAIESGTFKLKVASDNVGALLNERREVFQTVAGKKGIAVVGAKTPVEDTVFDHDRMSQVVDNLLSNAIKFSESGTTIHLDLQDQGDAISFAVRDEGQGVPEDEIEHLFDEFKKLSVKPTAGESSTGLGLSIVRRIITAHGGSIIVESTVGEGTTFFVTIPKSPEIMVETEAPA